MPPPLTIFLPTTDLLEMHLSPIQPPLTKTFTTTSSIRCQPMPAIVLSNETLYSFMRPSHLCLASRFSARRPPIFPEDQVGPSPPCMLLDKTSLMMSFQKKNWRNILQNLIRSSIWIWICILIQFSHLPPSTDTTPDPSLHLHQPTILLPPRLLHPCQYSHRWTRTRTRTMKRIGPHVKKANMRLA